MTTLGVSRILVVFGHIICRGFVRALPLRAPSPAVHSQSSTEFARHGRFPRPIEFRFGSPQSRDFRSSGDVGVCVRRQLAASATRCTVVLFPESRPWSGVDGEGDLRRTSSARHRASSRPRACWGYAMRGVERASGTLWPSECRHGISRSTGHSSAPRTLLRAFEEAPITADAALSQPTQVTRARPAICWPDRMRSPR